MGHRMSLAVGMFLVAALAVAAPAAADQDAGRITWAPPPIYLALGDSVAAGVGATHPFMTGYVPRLHDILLDHQPCLARPSCPLLALRNLGVPGTTSGSFIANPAQLGAAEALLRARNRGTADPRDDVKVVTIDIGGNDAAFILPFCMDPAAPQCLAAVEAQLHTFAANFGQILDRLRAAAGPDTPIAAMTYYNALPGCRFANLSRLADEFLEGGTPDVPLGLNDLIRTISAAHGVVVAETYDALGPADLAGGMDCQHPNDAGHRIIANAFATALGR